MKLQTIGPLVVAKRPGAETLPPVLSIGSHEAGQTPPGATGTPLRGAGSTVRPAAVGCTG